MWWNIFTDICLIKQSVGNTPVYDDVIKWKHFARSWPFERGIHRSPVNSPHKGQWRGALMIFFICASANGWVNNWDTGDYGVTVMCFLAGVWITQRTKFSKTWIKIKDLSFKKTHLKISSAKLWLIQVVMYWCHFGYYRIIHMKWNGTSNPFIAFKRVSRNNKQCFCFGYQHRLHDVIIMYDSTVSNIFWIHFIFYLPFPKISVTDTAPNLLTAYSMVANGRNVQLQQTS